MISDNTYEGFKHRAPRSSFITAPPHHAALFAPVNPAPSSQNSLCQLTTPLVALKTSKAVRRREAMGRRRSKGYHTVGCEMRSAIRIQFNASNLISVNSTSA